MYDIKFYTDKNGNKPVLQYIHELASKNDKDSRIKLQKINDYIEYLSLEGKTASEPYIKHIRDDIWELRPLKDRILFAAWDGQSFILLHHFMKKTQKTPDREIKQAKRELAEINERGLDNE